MLRIKDIFSTFFGFSLLGRILIVRGEFTVTAAQGAVVIYCNYLLHLRILENVPSLLYFDDDQNPNTYEPSNQSPV